MICATHIIGVLIICSMKYGALLGWGVMIYAVMYLVGSGLLIYGFSVGFIPLIVKILVLIATVSIATRALRLASWKDVLPYSFSWAVIAAVLDAVFWVPFAGWEMYASLGVWIGYALVVLIPLATPRLRHASVQTPSISSGTSQGSRPRQFSM